LNLIINYRTVIKLTKLKAETLQLEMPVYSREFFLICETFWSKICTNICEIWRNMRCIYAA